MVALPRPNIPNSLEKKYKKRIIMLQKEKFHFKDNIFWRKGPRNDAEQKYKAREDTTHPNTDGK